MDKATAAQGVRTYAKNAYTAYIGFAETLKAKLDNPNTVDAVQDFEKFMELRAKSAFYQETLSLDAEGNSPFDDDKVLDRMADERKSLTRLLLQSSTQQSGIYAVHQHHVREADKRILSDTYFVDDIDENEEN
jgi:hypothetical protein